MQEWGGIHVFKDEKMREQCETTGYTSLQNGEGPVAFYYSQQKPLKFGITVKDELNENESFRKRDPYPAWLCSKMYEITAVTPASPEQDSFSAWVCDLMKAACLRPLSNSSARQG